MNENRIILVSIAIEMLYVYNNNRPNLNEQYGEAVCSQNAYSVA